MKKEKIEQEAFEIVMDDQTMEAFVEDNINVVPRNKMREFERLTLKDKVNKINFFNDIKKMKEDARKKNSVANKVKEMMERRNISTEEAKDVLKVVQEYIDTAKERQITLIDIEIARLEEMKLAL